MGMSHRLIYDECYSWAELGELKQVLVNPSNLLCEGHNRRHLNLGLENMLIKEEVSGSNLRGENHIYEAKEEARGTSQY